MTSSYVLVTEGPRSLRRINAENPRLELGKLLSNGERLLQAMVLRPLDPPLREAGALPNLTSARSTRSTLSLRSASVRYSAPSSPMTTARARLRARPASCRRSGHRMKS